jgi:coatomer subunit beta'
MERVWCAAYMKGSNVLALGYDEGWFIAPKSTKPTKQHHLCVCVCVIGTVMIKLGGDAPAMSMDNAGKVVWAQHNDIQMLNVRAATSAEVCCCCCCCLLF